MPTIDFEIKLDFKDVVIRPKRCASEAKDDVDISRQIVFRTATKTFPDDVIPIIAANMDITGTFEMALALAEHKLITCIHKHFLLDDWLNFGEANADVLPYVVPTTGMCDSEEQKVADILQAFPDIRAICLDVANGYSEYFVKFVGRVRQRFPEHIIIAGNVATDEMVEQLLLSGADIVKVGVGPGSVCTTRIKTGVGYPQLSAVLECADAAHGLQGHIISDGGCTCPGDVAKAFGAGADFVMLGGMFAGHDESGGDMIERDGRAFKIFYGSGSTTAMNKHLGFVAGYRAPEGKTVEIPYRGKVKVTVLEILRGLRAACAYVGAASLKELPRRTAFIRAPHQVNQTFSSEP